MGRSRGHHVWRCLVVLLSLGIGGLAGADPPPAEGLESPRFTADFLVFFEEGQAEALVWIVAQVPASSIFFEAGVSDADLLVSWKVTREGRQVAGDVLTRKVSFETSDREGLAVMQAIPVRLRPDRYRIEVEIEQSGSGRRSMVTRNIRIQPLDGSAFALSSLFFTAEPPHQAGRRDGSLPAHPLVTRIVSQEIRSLTLAGEIYAPQGCRERYQISYRLVDDSERTVQKRVEDIPCEGFRTVMALPLDVDKLSFGDYRVEVTVELPERQEKIYREMWFAANETLLPIRSNFGRTLEIVEVIASEDELRALRGATPPEREALWEEFWAKRDPDPGTTLNEYRDDFFRRLRYANQNFSTALTPGWKSDRGYVLLKYGDPDRIERSVSSVDRPAAEIWRYDATGQWFRFVDEDGLGDFRLVSGSS